MSGCSRIDTASRPTVWPRSRSKHVVGRQHRHPEVIGRHATIVRRVDARGRGEGPRHRRDRALRPCRPDAGRQHDGRRGRRSVDPRRIPLPSRLRVEPMSRELAAALVRFHESLSPATTRSRFFMAHPHLTADEVTRFTRSITTTVKPSSCSTATADRRRRPLRPAPPCRGTAEVAFVVADAWQHRGDRRRPVRAARRSGDGARRRRFVADTLAGNRAMRTVFRHAGYPVAEVVTDGVVSGDHRAGGDGRIDAMKRALLLDLSGPLAESVAVRPGRRVGRARRRLRHRGRAGGVRAARRDGRATSTHRSRQLCRQRLRPLALAHGDQRPRPRRAERRTLRARAGHRQPAYQRLVPRPRLVTAAGQDARLPAPRARRCRRPGR